MAWNKTENKQLGVDQEVKSSLGLGAPISLNPSMVGRGYRDGWDIERAYREGVQRVTWVFRCIDAIATPRSPEKRQFTTGRDIK
jgi:hypothetical protein